MPSTNTIVISILSAYKPTVIIIYYTNIIFIIIRLQCALNYLLKYVCAIGGHTNEMLTRHIQRTMKIIYTYCKHINKLIMRYNLLKTIRL